MHVGECFQWESEWLGAFSYMPWITVLCLMYIQDGWTAIYNAALAGHANIVKILIDHGAKVDLQDTV